MPRFALSILSGLFLALPAAAQPAAPDGALTPEEVRALREEVKALRREVEELKKARAAAPEAKDSAARPDVPTGGEPGRTTLPPSGAPTSGKPLIAGEDYLPETSKTIAEEKRLPSGQGGVLDKPFLRRAGRNVYLGGYASWIYRDAQDERHETDFPRLIPFIYADVHERIKFATEIEIEDGHEVEVEFAFADVLFREEINFRAGVILDPLGKLNLVHDDPVQDLTDRPLVDQFILPSTLRELGLGFYGRIASSDPGQTWQVTYESYLVEGFRGLDDTGAIVNLSRDEGLHEARPHEDNFGGLEPYHDNNDSIANVTRVAFSPMLGLEVGGSVHAGEYDSRGDNWLVVYAVDFTFQHGPFELLAEGGYDAIQRDDFARASGVPGDLWGYYVQANYHFMPEWLRKALPSVFWDSSTFTAVVRWDETDLDENKRDRLTIGLNYRPIEDTVIKFDYQFNLEGGDLTEEDNDAFVFSIATYF